MKKTVQLDELAWGQILDGLTCRAEWYENAVQYYETGYCEGEVAEVRDEDEARTLAKWYRKLIEDIQLQIDCGEVHGVIEKPLWSDVPYGNYMDIVDCALEIMIGRASTQKELELISQIQEANSDPMEAAVTLVRIEKGDCDVPLTRMDPGENGGAEEVLNPRPSQN
jgi:hypothetical protein